MRRLWGAVLLALLATPAVAQPSDLAALKQRLTMALARADTRAVETERTNSGDPSVPVATSERLSAGTPAPADPPTTGLPSPSTVPVQVVTAPSRWDGVIAASIPLFGTILSGLAAMAYAAARKRWAIGSDADANAMLDSYAARLAPDLLVAVQALGKDVHASDLSGPLLNGFGAKLAARYPDSARQIGMTTETAADRVLAMAKQLAEPKRPRAPSAPDQAAKVERLLAELRQLPAALGEATAQHINAAIQPPPLAMEPTLSPPVAPPEPPPPPPMTPMPSGNGAPGPDAMNWLRARPTQETSHATS